MLKLADISLGSSDAKNELLNNTPEERGRFLKAFVCPPALTIGHFIQRQKYFVTGLKGTGKTALLRYLALKLEEDSDSISNFVLFKTELDEDLKKDFSKAARVQEVSKNSDEFEGDDFEFVWRWFIYRKIASLAQQGGALPFQNNSNLSSFIALVSSEALLKNEKVGLMRLVPTIRKGNIEISQTPKLGLEFDWDAAGNAKVNFNELVRRADDAFEKLQSDTTGLNIFFDELELNHGTTRQYLRDASIIRDLIVSVERINGIAKRCGYPLCLYAAVRSEVLNVASASGKEINKPIADFGANIVWNRPGLDATQQPLLSIIEQRINLARLNAGEEELASAELWNLYFPRAPNNEKPQVYILHNSWYRPRDIIRLLISIRDQYPQDTCFSLQGLEAIRKSYSNASWVELIEELRATYKPEDITGIENIFYGYKQVSSLVDLNIRADLVSKTHIDTKSLLEKTKLNEILKHLYRVGVIGNKSPKSDHMRFSFRGDEKILLDQDIFVHNALRAYFSM